MADSITSVKVEEEDVDMMYDIASTNLKGHAWKHILENGQKQLVDERLIDEVKKHPVIYDLTHPNNRDSFIKEKTWRQIALIVNVGTEYCKLRWKSIRDRFVKTEKQERERRAMGSHKVSKPYRFAERLMFLKDHMKVKHGEYLDDSTIVVREEDDDVANRSNLSDATRDTDEGDNVSEQGWALVDENRSATSPASPSSSHHGNRRKYHSNSSHHKRQRLQDDDSIQIINEIVPGASRLLATPSTPSKRGTNNSLHPSASLDDSVVDEHPLYDDVTYFLLSLAPAIRRLSPRKQSLAKINIQTMLHEVEFDN